MALQPERSTEFIEQWPQAINSMMWICSQPLLKKDYEDRCNVSMQGIARAGGMQILRMQRYHPTHHIASLPKL